MNTQLILIALGGLIGAVARFGLSLLFVSASGQFPYATLIANLVGCFLAGVLLAINQKTGALNHEWRAFLVTGVLGGFTTFSAFGIETFSFLQQGLIYQAVLYISLTVVGGLLTLSLAHLLTTGFLSK